MNFRQLVHSAEYQCLTELPAHAVHFQFSGVFAGQTVIWDAYLYTLAYYIEEVAQADLPCSFRQFIVVGDAHDEYRRIDIGLNLPVIDEPVLLKTMTMIRQYKRLQAGRHDFGPESYIEKPE